MDETNTLAVAFAVGSFVVVGGLGVAVMARLKLSPQHSPTEDDR